MMGLFRTHHDRIPRNSIDGPALSQRWGELLDETRQRLADAGAFVRNAVTTRPALALGAALAAGVVIGWLIKRRREQ